MNMHIPIVICYPFRLYYSSVFHHLVYNRKNRLPLEYSGDIRDLPLYTDDRQCPAQMGPWMRAFTGAHSGA